VTEPTPQSSRRPPAPWWLAAGLVVVTIALGWHTVSLLRARPAVVGNGRDVGSYGFDLTHVSLPDGAIVAGRMPRDGLRALVNPASWTVAQLAATDAHRHNRWLVPADRVVGVECAGEARAYPLRFLVWHEVVNDTVAGLPILVTYHALCDSAAAFRRDGSGAPPVFAVSGLLWNSGLLMYDRSARPSLWSPLLGRAVAGPAALAHRTLTRFPVTVCTWADWRAAHPQTTVLAPDESMSDQYASDPYASYFGSDLLRFPVEPVMPFEGLQRKTPAVIVAKPSGGYLAIPFPTVAARAGADGAATFNDGGMHLQLRYRPRPPAVALLDNQDRTPVLYAFAFAWYAAHPSDTQWVLPGHASAEVMR
jgi:hypothetical protein